MHVENGEGGRWGGLFTDGGERGVGRELQPAERKIPRVSLSVREMKCELGEWRGKRCSIEGR